MNQQQTVAPIGIDLGSLTSKIAVAKRGGVQVITNQANFRQTPCVVGYGPAERLIGQSGNIKIKSNWKDSIAFPMRFLGLRHDYPFLRAQKKFCPSKCEPKGDKIAFKVKYQGQEQNLYPQQVFAAYLNKLKLTLQKNNFESKQAVVAVPTYFTQQQRKALLDAAKIAELGITRLLNESTAVALDYGIFRKNELDATNARNVMFIDFGHSKLSTFVCSFTNTEMNVLEQDHYRHLGCRDMDYHLFQFYRGVFQKSSGGCDLSQSKKATLKIMEVIEKQRKVLSGNLEHELNLEYLMEQNDLHYSMKREEFLKISQPIFSAITQAMSKMKKTITDKKINIHSIEMVGGGTRIPAFIQIVRDTFGIEPSRTLNSSESVARGCALMAAIKSPLFRVADYTLNERVYYGVKFYWNFVEGEKYLGPNAALYPEKQGKYIYDVGAKVPSSKTVKFARKEAIQVLIEYEPFVNGFGKQIAYHVTKPQNPKEQIFGVSFKIRFNQNGLVVFDQCNLVEEWYEQVKVPKKKESKKEEPKKDESKKEGDASKPQPQKMDIQQEFEIKKTKKEKHSQIKYDSNTYDSFNAKDIQTFFTMESTMLNQDKVILETYQRKNELQSLIYSWKQKVNGSHRQFTKNEEVPDILKFLQDQNQWLYNDGQNASRGVYKDRITAIKNKVAPVAKRYDSFKAAAQELHVLEGCLKNNFDQLNSLDKKYEHITPQDRQDGFNMIENIKQKVIEANQKQKQLPKWEPLAITASQIKEKQKLVTDKVKQIMSKPAPPPPPKEEKKEQTKEEDKKKAAGEKMQEENKGAGGAGGPEKMQTE